MLRPDVSLIHRTKLALMISSDYDQVRSKIRDDLRGTHQVSISYDIWTSPQKIAYLGVLVYWVDIQFQFREHLLGFVPLELEHTGRELASELFKLLDFFGIKDRLLGVVTDNGSNNSTLTKELSKALSRT